MITVEPCRGCGRLLLVHPIANLTVRLDSVPLEPDGAVQALMGGIPLWRVTSTSVSGARPAELTALRERGSTEGPRIHQEHRCTAVSGPNTPKAVSASPKGSQRPPADRSALQGSVRRPERSSAPSAATPVSEPRCDGCGEPCSDGTYASVAIGDIIVWAAHVENCGVST